MEKLKLITGNLKLKILFIGISFLSLFFIFDTWEHNFDQYKVLQNQLNNRIQHANELRDEIGILSQQIEDLDNPEKLEVVLREYGYGNMIEINHGYGVVTRYGHNSKHLVKVGDHVKRGQMIALVGNTGRSTGPHLHYEVLLHGIPVSPKNYILED